MLEARIEKRRRGFVLEVELSCPRGGSLAILGASGAGKSTVLACLAGLEQPDRGYIRWQGITQFPPPLPLARRALGWLGQNERLFPHLDVAANVLFGLDRAQQRREAEWIAELRARLELDAIWRAPALEVSGGEMRRVALARMLARRPQLLLLDEPFADQDAARAQALALALREWQRRWDWTILAADPRPDELALVATRALLLDRGRIAAEQPLTACSPSRPHR